MKMQNKVALVTGAALGYKHGGPSIGSAIAFKLASEGAKVTVVDILEEMGERTAGRIRENGGTSLFIRTDVSKTDEVKRAIEMTRQEFGALHCLVNCAASYGGDIAKNVVEISEEDWQYIIDVNLNGYFKFAKYGIPLILQSGGGTIVNVSSCAAFRVLKDFSAYPVTKAAINALTRMISRRLLKCCGPIFSLRGPKYENSRMRSQRIAGQNSRWYFHQELRRCMGLTLQRGLVMVTR